MVSQLYSPMLMDTRKKGIFLKDIFPMHSLSSEEYSCITFEDEQKAISHLAASGLQKMHAQKVICAMPAVTYI